MDIRQVVEKSVELVNRSNVGMLGTINEKGYPQIKAMMKTRSSGIKEFWFCSNTGSKTVQRIGTNPKSSLYFVDQESFEGLLLTGVSSISYDDAKREEFWVPGMERYYPTGALDPDFALVCFQAERANYYHGLQNWDFLVE